MFENSLTSRYQIRCPEHQRSNITFICVEPKCQGWPLFCQECKNSYRFKQRHYGHQLHILQLNQGIEQLAKRIDRQKKAATTIYKEILGLKGVEGLLKWQEQKEQHFNSIQNHINTIKFQVEQEINNIIVNFQESLHKEKQKLYAQLQNYYKNYRQKFDKFSRLTQPIVAMQGKFKFYANTNALFFKISNEINQSKLGVWLSELKKTLSQTQKATNMPVQYAEQTKKYGQLANQIMDDLPRIRNLDYQQEMPLLMANTARQVLRVLVKLKQQRYSSFINRVNSAQVPTDSAQWKRSVSYK